jgi:holliday junction DNA helicase RuvA
MTKYHGFSLVFRIEIITSFLSFWHFFKVIKGIKSAIFVVRMIVFLDGKIEKKSATFVWLNVSGVGYEVHISLNTYEEIKDWKEGRLFIYHHVREDAEALFGFYGEEERSLFLQLIGVSGVGATTALVMLSSLKPSDLRAAIIQGNETVLTGIKGIGAKGAKRIILELKDKLLKSGDTIDLSAPASNNLSNDALTALISLGIARNTAYNAVQKVIKSGEHDKVEDVIKLALKEI